MHLIQMTTWQPKQYRNSVGQHGSNKIRILVLQSSSLEMALKSMLVICSLNEQHFSYYFILFLLSDNRNIRTCNENSFIGNSVVLNYRMCEHREVKSRHILGFDLSCLVLLPENPFGEIRFSDLIQLKNGDREI